MVKDFIFQKQDKNRGRKKSLWIILPVFLFFLVLFQFLAPSFLPRIFASVTRPVLVFKNGVLKTSSDFFSVFYFKSYLIEENNSLRSELARLDGVEAQLKLKEDENQSLQDALQMVPEGKALALASIILKPPRFPYDTLLVGGGANQKFEVGNLVYAGENILVGRVGEVYSRTSKIKLFSSSGEKTEAFVGPKAIPVELLGLGGGNFEAKIPRGADVLEDDSVYISGKNHDLIGVLGAITPAATDSFIKGMVRVPVNLFELQYVSVEKNSSLIKSPL
ncbi:MAG: rod shape-determining protein MreC [Candidatus Pacebacteria bacterium]|nr:rod shape-determining protein MreC [Candidatus Paceibacterota bacterium]MDD5357314.1 rod shape-determining protein MreC [Candidatus Paceibacterota bacterium]